MSHPDPYASPADLSETFESQDPFSRGASSPWRETWRILLRHPILLAACYLIVWLPLGMAIAYVDYHHIAEDDFASSYRLENAGQMWIGIIAVGAILSVASVAADRGKPTFSEAIGVGLARWGNLWTSYFCYGIVAAFGLILLVIPGIYFMVRAVYADVIAVSEQAHGPTAIRRSFELTKGRFWETFAVCLTIMGVYAATLIAFGAIYFSILAAIEIYNFGNEFEWILDGLVSLLFGIAACFSSVYLYCWYRKLLTDRTAPDHFVDEPYRPAIHTLNE